MRHALKLAAQQQIPWVPVHHMEAHALMAAMPGVLDATAATAAAATTAATAAGSSDGSAAGAAADGRGGSGGSSGGGQQGQPQMTFPALLLLVSGGHNMLVSEA